MAIYPAGVPSPRKGESVMGLIPAKVDLALQVSWAWLARRRCLQPLKPPIRAYRRIAAKARQGLNLLWRFARDPEYRARHLPRLRRSVAIVWYCTMLRLLRGPTKRPRFVRPGERP